MALTEAMREMNEVRAELRVHVLLEREGAWLSATGPSLLGSLRTPQTKNSAGIKCHADHSLPYLGTPDVSMPRIWVVPKVLRLFTRVMLNRRLLPGGPGPAAPMGGPGAWLQTGSAVVTHQAPNTQWRLWMSSLFWNFKSKKGTFTSMTQEHKISEQRSLLP